MADLTSLWVFVQKHRSKLGSVVLALVAFAAGWQMGRAMSPWYASHPIVFEEGTAAQDAGGDVASLDELRTSPDARVASSPTPTVAAAQDVSTNDEQTTMFVGSVNSDLYHFPDCPSAKRIKPENQIWFGSQTEAESAGYQPSQCTLEKLKTTVELIQ